MIFSALIWAASHQATSPAVVEIPPLPENLSELPMAEFPRKPAMPYKKSLKAKKLTRDCEPTKKLNDGEYYFVNVLLLTDGEGGLGRVTPISINCPALEEYTANFFVEQAKDNMPIGKNGKPIWYRSVLKFYW